MKVSELFEASKPGRAWNNKLSKIDKLMAWMYDKNILSKTDKERKDRVFYQYYKYYNDGVIPGYLKNKGFSKYSNKNELETELEKHLEDFIKEMLSKYLPKVDRKDFRIDNTIDILNRILESAENHDPHGLITYWYKKYKKYDEGFLNQIDEIRKKYDIVKSKLDSESPDTSNMVLSYRVDKMKKDKTITPESKKLVNDLYMSMDSLGVYVKNLIRSLEDIKNNLV
jgi:hypothetical protein